MNCDLLAHKLPSRLDPSYLGTPLPHAMQIGKSEGEVTTGLVWETGRQVVLTS